MSAQELWHQCVEWLVLIGALPRNHKTCYSNAEVFDLGQTLRDGVVLCNALNILMPGCVDESRINHRPQMSEFLCMQNARTVIYTLQMTFRIPPNELFSAQDLCQMTNFGRVLNCLSYLSCLPEISAAFKSFLKSTRQSRHRPSAEEEDIYSNLEELASEHSLADESEDLYDAVPEEKEEGIYGSLIDIKKNASFTASQKLDKRGCCIEEIVETENNYVSHLNMIADHFIGPLRKFISEHDLRIIFMNTEQLRPIHTQFRDELVKLKQSQLTAKFSEPFIKYSKRFILYGEYCSNLVDAQDCLAELMKKDETVRVKVEECQMNSSRNKFKLRELLCVPMQRILKYHLLVKELNKHTGDSHADKSNIGRALDSMQELSLYINEVKRDSEDLITINQIESGLEAYDGIPLRLYGRVRRDGELKVKFADDKNLSLRNLFLFDKALIVTKLRNDSYTLKDLIRLEDMQLDEMTNHKQGKAKWSFCWKLFSLTQGRSTYMLYSKTEAEKHKWLEAFKASFDNINPRALKGKEHHFEMQTFGEPSECSHCKKLLPGIFYQGYECSVTHARCHKSCLAETLKLIENNAIGTSTEGRHTDKAPPVPSRGRVKRTLKPEPSKPTTVASLSYKAHRTYTGIPAPPFPNAQIVTFQIGEPIDIVEQVSADWWKGRSFADYERIGFFPASFVSPIVLNSEKRNPAFVMNDDLRAPGTAWSEENDFDKPKPCLSSPEQLRNYYWYAGEIDRKQAEELLWSTPTGTFLIRRKQPSSLVISLKFQKDVKHIKILQTEEGLHYVAECKNFKSVQDLINFYQVNSLSGFFLGLETTLKYPYRDPVMFQTRQPVQSPSPPMRPPQISQRTRRPPDAWNGRHENRVTVNGRNFDIIGRAVAKFDFEARSEQELSLVAGQLVNIISKAGGEHGWWKGEHNGVIGYFPTTFVEEQFP